MTRVIEYVQHEIKHILHVKYQFSWVRCTWREENIVSMQLSTSGLLLFFSFRGKPFMKKHSFKLKPTYMVRFSQWSLQ